MPSSRPGGGGGSPSNPFSALLERVARYLQETRERASPRLRLVVRAGLPLVFSAATVIWLRQRARAVPFIREVPYSDFVRLVKSSAVRDAAVGAGGLIFARLAESHALTTSAVDAAVEAGLAGPAATAVGSAAAPKAAQMAAVVGSSIVQTKVLALPQPVQDLLIESGVRVGAARPSALVRAVQGAIVAAPVIYLGIISAMLWRVINDQLGGGDSGGGAGNAAERATAVSFDDIAGMPLAKAQVLEVVDCLRDPLKYAQAGARCPHGVLLVGPPGTGKTLLARAIASCSGASFMATSGSDFVEVFVGRGAARVRSAFKNARTHAPCVLFIDEMDSLGRARSHGSHGSGASDEHEHAVNALLAEMDGFAPAPGVLVVGATNRFEILDEALVRPGRFDRVIRLALPDAEERAAILQVHLRRVNAGPDVSAHTVAARTSGFSGAELAALVNEAAMAAVRHGRTSVEAGDFADALRIYRSSRSRSGAHEEPVPEQGGDLPLSPALLAAFMQQMGALASQHRPGATVA